MSCLTSFFVYCVPNISGTAFIRRSTTAHHITPHHSTTQHTTSHHTTSNHITTHHITPHHITPGFYVNLSVFSYYPSMAIWFFVAVVISLWVISFPWQLGWCEERACIGGAGCYAWGAHEGALWVEWEISLAWELGDHTFTMVLSYCHTYKKYFVVVDMHCCSWYCMIIVSQFDSIWLLLI